MDRDDVVEKSFLCLSYNCDYTDINYDGYALYEYC